MDKLWELLEKAGTALGVAGEQVYGVLIRQAYVEAVLSAVMIIAVIVGFVVMWKATAKLIAHAKEDYYSESDVLAYIVRGCACIFAPIALYFDLRTIIQVVVNPAMWVLEYLTSMF